mgnify:CR=1 FL=1
MLKYIIIIGVIFLAVPIFLIMRTIQTPGKIRKAEELMDEGEYSRSSEIVRKILDKKKDYVPARFLRAQLLTKQGQFLLAISEFNSIINIANFNKYVKELDIRYNLAYLYNTTQNWQKEIEEYKLILTFNPDDVKANHRIGHALYKKKNYKRVKEHLTKAVIFDPKLTDCFLPLGVSCFKISNYEKAEEYLSQDLKLPGDHHEAEYHLGIIYKMKKDNDNAVLMLEKAKIDKKFFIKSLFAIAEIYFEQQMFGDAIDTLEQGLNSLTERSEESHAYRYLLAECYEMENKIKEAVHHWEKIANEDPNFRSTKIKLDSYRSILEDANQMTLFGSSLEELQSVIVEMISSLNFNIISKHKMSQNEYMYKAYNIKRINDPPILFYFNRTTREVTEGQILDFLKHINEEKCKSGIYITASKFSLRARSSASAKNIDLYDSEFVNKSLERIIARKKNM